MKRIISEAIIRIRSLLDKFVNTTKKTKGFLFLCFLLIALAVSLFLVSQKQIFKPKASLPGIDLDVTYIERIPRYFRYNVSYPDGIPTLITVPGDSDNNPNNDKHWPDENEEVTYLAHVINKGQEDLNTGFVYQWLVNGVLTGENSATLSGLKAGEETTAEIKIPYSSSQSIQFQVDPTNVITESSKNNNALTFNANDLTISIWIEKGQYDAFNAVQGLKGTHSFEDWIQAHFEEMNKRFVEAKYPTSPSGSLVRVRIDKIVVGDEFDAANSPFKAGDPDQYLIDGRWQFTDGDSTNNSGITGVWQNYVNSFVGKIDDGLIHELAHQLGVIDLYRFNVPNDPSNNNRFQVTDQNNQIINPNNLPPVFKNAGLMGGGDITPYTNNSSFESHTAAALNTSSTFRRGFYGEYLFDTPTVNYLKVLDTLGNPLGDAQVSLYQKDATTEYFDNTPEITGKTDGQGIFLLPNRSASSGTTVTGHTLKNNPFGKINVVGTNGTMFMKIVAVGQEQYGWLTLLDLNLAYWSGNKDQATYTIKTSTTPYAVNTTNLALNAQTTTNRQSVAITGHETSKAVDGDKTNPLSTWQIGGQLVSGDWWQIDLGKIYDLTKITIYPFANNYSDWCSAFHVDVSNTGEFAGEQKTVLQETNSPHLQALTYTFPVTQGRFLRLINDQAQNWVQLQEVEIFDTNVISPTLTPTLIPTPIPTSTPVPTATPTPIPIPLVANLNPVIVTTTLPVARWLTDYKTEISGYDLNLDDTLVMNITGLPLGLSQAPCNTWKSTDRSQIICSILGRPLAFGTYKLKVALRDNKGGIVGLTLPLSVKRMPKLF